MVVMLMTMVTGMMVMRVVMMMMRMYIFRKTFLDLLSCNALRRLCGKDKFDY